MRNGTDDVFGHRVKSWAGDRLDGGFVDGWEEGVGDGVGVRCGVCDVNIHTKGGREEARKR